MHETERHIDTLAEKTILVCGGRGFLGRAIVAKLKNINAAVTSISTPQNATDSPVPGIAELFVDIRDRAGMENALRDQVFDYVINASGYIDHSAYLQGGRSMIETHFTGALNLISAVYRPGLKRFVQIGSSDSYGSAPAPQNEEMREAPICPYSAAKTAATHLIQVLARTEGFPGVVLRPFLIYGPGQKKDRFIPQVIGGCLEDASFPVSSGYQLRDFCYVEDIAEGLLRSLIEPAALGQVINLASGQPVAIRSVVEQIVQIIKRGKPDFGAWPARPIENPALYADTSKARDILKWEPRISLETGLRRTIEWYRQGQKDENGHC